MLGLNGYQDEISQLFSKFWGIFQQIQDFQWVSPFFEGLGYVRAKWILRQNFPNFPSILRNLPQKFNIFNGFLTFFEVLGCIMTKWIPRFNFQNFLSIIVDFHSSSISFQRNLQSLDKAGLLNQFGPF